MAQLPLLTAIYQLRLVLAGISPMIWRRLLREHSIPGGRQLSRTVALPFVAGSLDTIVETSAPTLH
jgi:hypothetical protein